jgi:6-phosphogluconolactonase/glucosamine-6-phosphate isomerase/deaminase
LAAVPERAITVGLAEILEAETVLLVVEPECAKV